MDLSNNVSILPSIGPVYQKRLQKLGIEIIEDLLLHIPYRYLDFRQLTKVNMIQIGDSVTIKGRVVSIKNQYTRSGKKLQIARVRDDSGEIAIVWFNRPFLVRTIFPGDDISLAGKVDWFGRNKALVSPEYEIVKERKARLHTVGLIPVYPETHGISSKWLRTRISGVLSEIKLDEYLPDSIIGKYNFPKFAEAVRTIHFPQNLAAVEPARRRLAFEELLLLQLSSLKRKIEWKRNLPAYKLGVDKSIVESFIKTLPFELTKSQKEAIDEILSDLAKDKPMNRLLEGDVGSGKTVVAAIAALIAFANGYQTVIMAPTQILASQHYETLKTLFDPLKIRVSLVTSAFKKSDLGRADIFVGTHALISKRNKFDKVALVVIDEQHRFGVAQRAELVKKSKNRSSVPHILTMTATPIPRTVALTIYGDLDLSVLSDMPQGRIKVTTWIVPPIKRGRAYDWIRGQIKKNKIQVFNVCPLIEESEKETMQDVKAVTKEYQILAKIFKGLKLGLLHGRIPAKRKEEAIGAFKEGKTDILVTTPVVEVGIDIANATIMLIEGAERFGLAQLHQLRGRVGRGKQKSYCLLFTDSKSRTVLARLSALQKYNSGFELAELDLKLRGPGEVFGTKQHGFPELKVATWHDSELIREAGIVAEKHPELFSLLHAGEPVS